MSKPIDKRILNLSYSSLLLLHSCPRKFEIYRRTGKVETADPSQSLTFSYGHTVGAGIQGLLEGLTLQQVIWNAFINWEMDDLFYENPKQNKSFFGAIHALRQFAAMREAGYLDDYEIVQYQGKPACELSFAIYLPDGFIYRGFVDAVLRSRSTGKVIVLECKTTSLVNVNPAEYKNSAQAIGYSIVLDAIFPTLSSYEVLYLVYQSKSSEYRQLPFEKSYFQRALWIRELLLDVEMIKLYEAADIYPMHGESCMDWFRECEYMQTCTLSTDHLAVPLTPEKSAEMDAEIEKFQIKITIEDLIKSQLSKNVSRPVPVAKIMNVNEPETLDELL